MGGIPSCIVDLNSPGIECNVYTYSSPRGDVEFTWDERKNRVNRRRHGISFETAVLVFDDPHHVSVQDREGSGLARFVAERYDLMVGVACGIALILLAIFGIHWASVIVIGLLLAAVVWWLTALRAGERATAEPAAA